MLAFLFGVVKWVLIPAILLAGLAIAVFFCNEAEGRDLVPAVSGLLAGLVGTTGYAVTQIPAINARSTADVTSDTFNFSIIPVAIGFIIGFTALWIGEFLAEEGLIRPVHARALRRFVPNAI